jgi:EAL domain-containing protein (putative c-di-GMP-specific phosphodiesterase class I)
LLAPSYELSELWAVALAFHLRPLQSLTMNSTARAKCVLNHDLDGTVFLYVSNPTLIDTVLFHLREIGAMFIHDHAVFRIFENQEHHVSELRDRLSQNEIADIRATRGVGAALLAGAPAFERWQSTTDTTWFDRALREGAFTTFFQPIIDVRNERVFGHECLIRLFSDKAYEGAQIIEVATARGKIHVSDSYFRKLSVRSAGVQRQANTKVFINFMPSAIYDPLYCLQPTVEEISKSGMQPGDIVFEAVESEQIRDLKHLKAIGEYCRKQGFGFALDDVGTGSNSFQLICELMPDYIKIDRSLISRIGEPMYYSAIGKLNDFAGQYSLNVIAEGIENAEISDKARALGIPFMQGYFFGRPSAHMASTAA